MSFTDKFKNVNTKAKTTTMVGAMVLAALVAPVKGQVAEVEAKPRDAITATANTDAMRQQRFETAVRSGAPKEEIVKYIDFPEFFPVTKDGQFDKTKATELSKTLAPYMKVLAEEGATMSAADAYKAFKETTGQKNVSLEDFKRVVKMAEEANEGCKTGRKNRKDLPIAFLWAGLALMFGASGVFGIFDELNPQKVAMRENMGSDMIIFAEVFAVILSVAAVSYGKSGINARRISPETEIQRVYASAYDSYVDQTIRAQQKQLKQKEWDQVRSTLEQGSRQ